MATFPGGQASVPVFNKENLPVSRAEFMAAISNLTVMIETSSSSSSSVTLSAAAPTSGDGAEGDIWWNYTDKFLYIKDSDGWNIH